MGYKTRGNYPTGWGKSKKLNIMSNEDRIKMGLEPDPKLEKNEKNNNSDRSEKRIKGSDEQKH